MSKYLGTPKDPIGYLNSYLDNAVTISKLGVGQPGISRRGLFKTVPFLVGLGLVYGCQSMKKPTPRAENLGITQKEFEKNWLWNNIKYYGTVDEQLKYAIDNKDFNQVPKMILFYLADYVFDKARTFSFLIDTGRKAWNETVGNAEKKHNANYSGLKVDEKEDNGILYTLLTPLRLVGNYGKIVVGDIAKNIKESPLEFLLHRLTDIAILWGVAEACEGGGNGGGESSPVIIKKLPDGGSGSGSGGSGIPGFPDPWLPQSKNEELKPNEYLAKRIEEQSKVLSRMEKKNGLWVFPQTIDDIV